MISLIDLLQIVLRITIPGGYEFSKLASFVFQGAL